MRHTHEDRADGLDDSRLIDLLRSFRPAPSRRYYERIARMPWNSRKARRPFRLAIQMFRSGPLRSLSGAALALVLVSVWLLAVPATLPAVRNSLQELAAPGPAITPPADSATQDVPAGAIIVPQAAQVVCSWAVCLNAIPY